MGSFMPEGDATDRAASLSKPPNHLSSLITTHLLKCSHPEFLALQKLRFIHMPFEQLAVFIKDQIHRFPAYHPLVKAVLENSFSRLDLLLLGFSKKLHHVLDAHARIESIQFL